MENKTYYRVYDTQTKTYFATGYNAKSMQELINDFSSYINCSAWEDEEQEENFGSWEQIADYLQDVYLEESKIPFEEQEF